MQNSLKTLLVIFKVCFFSLPLCAQFTLIATHTNADLNTLALHNDTVIVSGRSNILEPNSKNYLAKYFIHDSSLEQLNPPGPLDYTNIDLQVVNDTYYSLSIEGSPYDHNLILKSIDYGYSWNTIYDTAGLFLTLTMLDTTFGIITGSFGAYATTENGDTNWSMQDSLHSSISASAIPNDSTLLMLSTGGFAYLSEDKGQNWNWITGISNTPVKVCYVNQDTVYAISQRGLDKSYFHYSFNKGYSWNTRNIGRPNSNGSFSYFGLMYDMVFDNPTHGYLVGSKDGMSTILETNDSGATWNQVNSNFDGEFLSIVKIDNTNFIIGGSNGTLLKWDATIPTSNIYNNTHNNSFTASPNPTKGNLKIDFPDNIISANVAVVNSSGQVVYIEDNAHEPIEINLNKYPNGNYYIIFKYKNKLSSKKIVVKH